MDVISLLENKKRCLRHYLRISERFLASAEAGDVSGLAALESEREAVIRTLTMLDRRITDAAHRVLLEDRTPALARAVGLRLEEEVELVARILGTDNGIFACLEREKARLGRDINASQRSRELTGKFRSGRVPGAGDGLDKTI